MVDAEKSRTAVLSDQIAGLIFDQWPGMISPTISHFHDRGHLSTFLLSFSHGNQYRVTVEEL